jgi:hypothetical protein
MRKVRRRNEPGQKADAAAQEDLRCADARQERAARDLAHRLVRATLAEKTAEGGAEGTGTEQKRGRRLLGAARPGFG